ncbi:hypothetical protein NM208_g7196 [Fusarium decemcellulare]|uniref:Uncharacterized protein n=1 Tax=Fusarium decemcellulare TaxID=57161 RepID=A0ACC1SA19_9HYPO|nr:hypothetical protein NM208_g7196 [Fusarium decemcellulare]
MSSLMLSESVGSSWRHCTLKYIYSDPLYRYKKRPTPKRFSPDERLLAFRIGYDLKAHATQLELFSSSPRNHSLVTETMEFSDTKRHFQYDSTDTICGWYLGDGETKEEWDTMRSVLEEFGEDQLSHSSKFRNRLFGVQTSCHGIESLWAIRGYFIGPDTTSSPPYITVLCSDDQVSKQLVDSIHERLKVWEDWGVTRLPKVRVLEYGFRSGGPSSSNNSEDSGFPDSDMPADEAEAESHLERIEVELIDNHSTPIMTNENLPSWVNHQHRCGIRLNVTRGSKVIAKGTIGGLIKVGDRLYGLTVAHIFSPTSAVTANQHSYLDQVWFLTSAAVETTNPDNDDEAAILRTWQHARTSSIRFDWALVEMPGLQHFDPSPDSWDNVNLVPTVSGDFRPILAEPSEPCRYIQVVLATPESTHCLRGIFVGSETIVKIPGSPSPYAAWVLRMEQPWLIQPGDSGSWAFDAHSGNLLGVLIAGCPDLQEAYILPAYEIIQDIKVQLKKPVGLANCHRIGNVDRVDLARFFRDYEDMNKRLASVSSVRELKNLESYVAMWNTENSTRFADVPAISSNPHFPEAFWIDPLSVLSYQDLLSTGNIEEESRRQGQWGSRKHNSSTELCKRTLRQPPLQCYNFINSGIRAYTTKTHHFHQDNLYIMKLRHMWRHLILGQTRFSLRDDDAPQASRSAHRRIIENETNLMTHMGPQYPRFRHPWDRHPLTTVLDEMRDSLERKVSDHWEQFKVSLPETKELKLGPSGAVALYAILVLNKSKHEVLVLGPSVPRGEDSSYLILPFTLGDKTLEEMVNVKQLLKTKLERDITDFDQLQKLNLGPNHPGCYLVEHNRHIDMVVYEAVLPIVGDEPRDSAGRRIFWLDVCNAEELLRPPFSAAIGKSSAIK